MPDKYHYAVFTEPSMGQRWVDLTDIGEAYGYGYGQESQEAIHEVYPGMRLSGHMVVMGELSVGRLVHGPPWPDFQVTDYGWHKRVGGDDGAAVLLGQTEGQATVLPWMLAALRSQNITTAEGLEAHGADWTPLHMRLKAVQEQEDPPPATPEDVKFWRAAELLAEKYGRPVATGLPSLVSWWITTPLDKGRSYKEVLREYQSMIESTAGMDEPSQMMFLELFREGIGIYRPELVPEETRGDTTPSTE
jgi:hypothetical protein